MVVIAGNDDKGDGRRFEPFPDEPIIRLRVIHPFVVGAVVRRAARNNLIGHVEDVAGHYQDIGRQFLDAPGETIKGGRHAAGKAHWIVRRSRLMATQMHVRKMQESRHWTIIAGVRLSEYIPFNDADGGEFLDTVSYPSGFDVLPLCIEVSNLISFKN